MFESVCEDTKKRKEDRYEDLLAVSKAFSAFMFPFFVVVIIVVVVVIVVVVFKSLARLLVYREISNPVF